MTDEYFDPIDYGFRWTEDWYEFNRSVAIHQARKARDAQARQLKAKGREVRKFTLGSQLRTMGGIGTSRPEIELVVPVYGVTTN